MPDLTHLLGRLIQHRVEFVVVGGYAAVAHGGTMLTQDVDVCCDFAPDNLLRLQEAVADLHPVHRMTPSRVPLRLTADSSLDLSNLYLDTDLGQLDCIGAVKGLGSYPVVREASVEIQLQDGPCRVLGLDALIEAKAAMGRPRDMETLIELRAIRENLSRNEK